MELKTKIAGLEWKTPLAVSAGPLTRNSTEIRRVMQQGKIGAVVTKTVYMEDRLTPKPTMVKVHGGLVNYDWSGTGLSTWEKYFADLQDAPVPVIASMLDASPRVLALMAVRLEKAGAQALEVPLYPTVTIDQMKERVGLIKAAVKIPLLCKLGSNLPSTGQTARALVEAGADGLVAINTIGPCLVLDASRQPFLGSRFGNGYLSGPAIKGLALRTVAELAQAVDVPVIGGGGIASAQDVVDFLAVGASAVFVHSAAILQGLPLLGKIMADLENYCAQHGIKGLEEIKGQSLPSLVDEPKMASPVPTVDFAKCSGCGLCATSCIYHSLAMKDHKLVQNREKCFGCGLCISICPKGALGF